VAFPDVRLVLGEDVLEVAEALDAQRELGRHVDRPRPLVPVLDEQPAAAVAAAPAAGADDDPAPLHLHAVEPELQLALGHCLVDVFEAGLRRPRPFVPEHHDAGPVALRDHALELAVVERVVLHVHRQTLVGRVE